MKFILILAMVMFPIISNAQSVQGNPRVVDGDTLVLNGERIRLHGINAVESRQTCKNQIGREFKCGQAATQAMQVAVVGGVRCVGRERDHYGRLLAICYNGAGEDLSRRMVREGWATAYRRYSQDYVVDESFAKQRGYGIWAGEFQDPEAYNHGNRGANVSGAISNVIGQVASGARAKISSSGIGSALVGYMYAASSPRQSSGRNGHTSGGESWVLDTTGGYQPFDGYGQQNYNVSNRSHNAAKVSYNSSDRNTQPQTQVPMGVYEEPVAGGLSARQVCMIASAAGRPCN